MSDFDATVVGAGPNGLSAALELARSGRRVLVVEGADQIGGGTRTAELTLPGFRHDICSAIHPSGVASPFFEEIDLDVDWIQPPIPFTHPLGEGRVAALHRSVTETAMALGDDRTQYEKLMLPLTEDIAGAVRGVLSPISVGSKDKMALTRLALVGGLPASMLVKRFENDEAKAILAGLAAHSIAPFTAPATSGVAVMLGAIGHVHGWPLVRGGSQAIANELASRLESLGAKIETGRWVDDVSDLPGNMHVLDVMPPAAHQIGRERISASNQRRLAKWKPGPGVFKVDWALDGPIPWLDDLSSQSATVHVGGTYDEVAFAEAAVSKGEHPEKPFVLLSQQSPFDETRAPVGKHTAWGYCHVPNGSDRDMTDAIERQIERFAPGFRDLVLARGTRSSAQYESHNPNYVGGDIGGGAYGIKKVLQLGAKRPYQLGGGIYLCSSATPPGAGVHGMCGYNAARAAID